MGKSQTSAPPSLVRGPDGDRPGVGHCGDHDRHDTRPGKHPHDDHGETTGALGHDLMGWGWAMFQNIKTQASASNWIVFSIIEARFAGSSMHFGRGDEGYDGGKKKR